MSRWICLILSVLALGGLTSCANIFTEAAPKTSDEAIFFDVQQAVDKGQWAVALAKIAQLSTGYQSRRATQVLKASAYAGRCGLDFLTLITSMGSATGGKLMTKLFNGMPNSTASKVQDCLDAETTLKALGTFATRTSDENMMVAFLGLAKVGAILNYRGDNDTNDTSDDANGTLDPGFTGCQLANLPDADASELVTGISLFILGMAATGSSAGGSGTSDLTTICASLSGACSIENTSDVTAAHRTAVRGAVRENESVGLGICTGDAATCACVGS